MPDYARQHLVSKVLLKRFADATGTIGVYDIRADRQWQTGPAVLGVVADFIPFEPADAEARWSEIEGRLPEAFALADAGSAPADERLASLMKDAFALHWARSHTFRRMWDDFLPKIVARRTSELGDRHDLDAVFRDLTRLEPVGPGAEEYAAERMRAAMEEHFETGEFLRERVIANFEEARRRLDGLAVELVYVHEGELLIGDTPALTLRKGHPGVGPLGGVPWEEADFMVLPLGPRHAVGFASQPAVLHCDASVTELINSIQTAGAFRHVYFRPDSGLGDLVRQRLGHVDDVGSATDS